MGVFASFGDVQLRYEGNLPSDKEPWVEAKIVDAEGKLTALIPSLLDPSKTSAARSANAKAIVCEAVLRVYRNPAGWRSEGMDVLSAARSSATESGQLQFTAEELASVRLRSKRRGFGTIRTTPFNPLRNVAEFVESGVFLPEDGPRF